MAATTTSNPASVADRLITYLSKKLLYVQQDNLVLDQFAVLEDLPMKASVRTIRFFKPAKAGGGSGQFSATPGLYSSPTTTDVVHALTEGTPITNYRENDWTKVDATLKQYGAATKLSDIVTMIDAYQPLRQNMDLMGRDAALHYDTVCRNAIQGSTHPDGSTTPLTHGSNGSNGCELFVSGSGTIVNSGTSSTNFSTLAASTTQANGLATRLFVLAAGTRLRTNKAPKLKSKRYVCVLPPAVQHDLVRDTDYKNAFQGRGNEGVYRGYIGEIDGFIFVEATNPFIEDDQYGVYESVDTGVTTAIGLVWSTLFLGAGAYGAPKLAGTRSPLRPQFFINDKADKSDPLNQFLIAGWKAYYMAMGLDTANIVVGRSKSTFL
jgi:N4-gp56 family major capsid protein